MTNKKYITYNQYLMHTERLRQLELQGVELVYTKSTIKIILGSVCLGIAIIPNGTGLIMYPLGFSLLASGGIDIISKVKSIRHKITLIKIKIRQMCNFKPMKLNREENISLK